MRFLKFFFVFILFFNYFFNSFSQPLKVAEKLNIEDVVWGIYDIPSEKEGMNSLQVFIKIPYSFFRFIKEDDNFAANYEFTVEITNIKSDINEDKSTQEEIFVSNIDDTNSFEKTILKDFKFEVSPGKYSVRLLITDQDLKKSITQTKEITLKNFWIEKLGISDLIIYVNNDSATGTGKNILTSEPNIDVDYNSTLIIDYYIFNSNPEKNIVLNSKIVPEFYQDSPVYEEKETISDTKNLIRKKVILTADSIFNGPFVLKINAESDEIKVEKEMKFSLLWENFPITKVDIEPAIEQMKYVLSDEEYEKTSLMNRDEKSEFFDNFWSEYDLDTTTVENEVMKEYFKRVNYSNQNFTNQMSDGWESDMGKIYLLYGTPDKISKRHNLIPPYETWEYNNINKRYIFWDEFSTGIFKLKSSYNIKKGNGD